jgi:HEPN domain-containing protein
MTTRDDLKKIARARLKDARSLLSTGRYDGGVYLCGYAVETALKARICQTLKWAAFPSSRKEFEGLISFKTHDLELLLRLSGQAPRLKAKYLADWSLVSKWNPEARYERIGNVTRQDLQAMIDAASNLMETLI